MLYSSDVHGFCASIAPATWNAVASESSLGRRSLAPMPWRRKLGISRHGALIVVMNCASRLRLPVAGIIAAMREIDSSARRPGSSPRLLFRLPLLLERAGIRWTERLFARLMGVQWIVLETIGRRSGRPHGVVLDVVGYDRAH